MNSTLSNGKWAVGIILFLVAFGLPGCAAHKPFELFDSTTVINSSGTIAVISADRSEETIWLAEALTKELKARSTFKVFTQAKVGLRLGKYPVPIKKGQPETPEKPVWLGKGDKAKVDAMGKNLKVKYLIVVWTELTEQADKTGKTGKSESYNVRVDANALEYPKGRVIGYSFVSGKKSEADVNKMIKDSAVSIADKFIRVAKAEPQKKKD